MYAPRPRLFPILRLILLAELGSQLLAQAAEAAPKPAPDEALARYFRAETERLADNCLREVKTFNDWKATRETYRQQLLEMLGLFPLPGRTDLKATITG